MSRTVTGGARNFISVGSLDPANANTTGATAIARATAIGPVFSKPDELDQAIDWVRRNS